MKEKELKGCRSGEQERSADPGKVEEELHSGELTGNTDNALTVAPSLASNPQPPHEAAGQTNKESPDRIISKTL